MSSLDLRSRLHEWRGCNGDVVEQEARLWLATVTNRDSTLSGLTNTHTWTLQTSDGWSDRFDVVEKQEEFALGGISIRIHSAYVNDFDDYYFALNPFTNQRNPWFAEFWETRFQCNLELGAASASSLASAGGLNRGSASSLALLPAGLHQRPFVRPPGAKIYNRSCTGKMSALSAQRVPPSKARKAKQTSSHSRLPLPSLAGRESLRNNHKQDAKMAFVQKSIITMALGLDSMQRAICPPNKLGLCPEMLPVNGSILLQHLMNVSFSFLNEQVSFDEQGDPPGKYEILNFQRRRSSQAAEPGNKQSGPDYQLASASSNADESAASERRRLNPMYDSYSTLRVYRPRQAAAAQALVLGQRKRRGQAKGTGAETHLPASGYSSTSGYEYVHVGSWKSSDGLSLFGDIRWPSMSSPVEQQAAHSAEPSSSDSGTQHRTSLLPKSVCSLPCARGHAKVNIGAHVSMEASALTS